MSVNKSVHIDSVPITKKFLSKDGFLSGTINSWKEFAYIITLTACLGKTLNLD